MAQPSEKKQTFEQSLTELENLVTEVEQGKIPLEQSLTKYEQGMNLIKHCRTILESAEKRIELIAQQHTTAPPSDQSPDQPPEK